ncbi:N-formylglutamate amidohydrolase [Desulfoluna sp.]|uniref:N-formylglutamate amidohydrolase n=1 Tax=Desulfoluna sp. TaxID=2045199 RepID=UPI00260CAEEF|nr:N-formylglutamate amidohydrolase [Desulfoluna sp.]
MQTLPLGLSLPHGGLETPGDLRALSRLSADDIEKDSDEGSHAMARALRPWMAQYAETSIARAFIDLNREETDLTPDGVVKTLTSWNVPIYTAPLSPETVQQLIATYHRPYHHRLSQFVRHPAIRLSLDLHSMAEHAPPISDHPGTKRPRICLGNARHTAASQSWIETMADLAARFMDPDVQINTPFAGGWITRCHGREMPWIQIEVSREPWISWQAKGEALVELTQRFIEVLKL